MPRTRPTLAILALAGMPYNTIAAQPGTQPDARAAARQVQELPVTAVTLYRSGVGSFERSGTVTGTTAVSLNATADQINDLLKSLVVLDLDGGRVGTVTYTADEPINRLRTALGIGERDEITLGGILELFQGAAVTVETTDTTYTGRILGTDTVTRSDGAAHTTITTKRLSILTSAGLRTVTEHDIRSLTLDDPQLRADMDALLLALAQQRTERARSLEIELRGEGDRRVRAAYVQETPVWKTSYRIILPESESDPIGLQGWAIVENTTDSDWNGIDLALVAGRPVGFEMDLSQPLFVDRPEVPVPFDLAASSREIAAGRTMFDDTASDLASAEWPQISLGSRGRGMTDELPAGLNAPVAVLEAAVAREDALRQSMTAGASAGEAGEVFFYRLADPVTIGRQQSAMLPIMAEEIEGRRVSISSPADAGHPMLGVEITNSTDLKLMPGPISVYDSTAFAGDAQIGYVGPGDERLLAFGVDLDIDIERSSDQRSVLTNLIIRDGVFVRTSAEDSTQTVTLTSNDEDRARTLIVEVPKIEGWDLASDGPEPYEVAPGVYRFEVELPPSDSNTLTVTQQRTIDSRVGLARAGGLDYALRHHRTGAASDAVLEAAREFAQRQAEVNRLAAQVNNLDADINTIVADQNRIRGLLGPLSRQDQLYSRYIRQLDASETKLEGLRTQRAEVEADRRKRQAELEEFVRTLNVE